MLGGTHAPRCRYLRGGEAPVGVLLPAEPADDLGCCPQVVRGHLGLGEVGQQDVGGHLHLRRRGGGPGGLRGGQSLPLPPPGELPLWERRGWELSPLLRGGLGAAWGDPGRGWRCPEVPLPTPGGTCADAVLGQALQLGLLLLPAPRQPENVGKERLRVGVIHGRNLQAPQG